MHDPSSRCPSPPLVSDRFVIAVGEEVGRPTLFTSVKRYTFQPTDRSRGGLTLLLTHGVTFRELAPPSTCIYNTIPS